MKLVYFFELDDFWSCRLQLGGHGRVWMKLIPHDGHGSVTVLVLEGYHS